MCWFAGGVTRSSGPLEVIGGLGLLPGSFTVHADGEPERLPVWLAAVRSGELPGGWAADDGVGLLFHGTRMTRVVTSRPGTAALRVDVVGGELVRHRIEPELLGAGPGGPGRLAAGAGRHPRAARAAPGDAALTRARYACADGDRPPRRSWRRTSRATARRSASGSRPGTPGRRQSLAEATVPAGGSTLAHFHRESEEIYLVTSGSGRLLLGEETRAIIAGDCVVIPPGTVHRLWADPAAPLVVVCSCVPPYSHEDTVLVD